MFNRWFKRSRKKLIPDQSEYDKGFKQGYNLGYESGIIATYNKLTADLPSKARLQGSEPSPVVMQEIDEIMRKKGE